VFDDPNAVSQSNLVRHLNPISFVTLSTRPLTDYTYAINYAIGGLDPFSFHLTNVLLHAVNGVLVYAIAWLTLGLPVFAARYGAGRRAIAFAAAALFAAHPLATETVAYVSSRSEVLALNRWKGGRLIGGGTPGDGGWLAASAGAARALRWLCEDEREAYACKRLLLQAWLILQQARGGSKLPLELRELSSAQALSQRLSEIFTAVGMEVACDVRRARALAPRPPVPSRARFVGRWLGTTALAAEVPPAGPDVLAAGEVPGQDQLVVEAGLLVLVARRPR